MFRLIARSAVRAARRVVVRVGVGAGLWTGIRARRRFGAPILLTIALIGALIGALIAGGGRSSAAASAPAAAAMMGSIAYVAGDKEIRVVEADGSNDRLVWGVPDPQTSAINGLAWKPDGTGFAFASDHEQACSLRQADIYTVNVVGSSVRRITNAPACAGLAAYPKGAVTVQVANTLFDVSLVFVYVQGAPEAKPAVVPPGTTKTVTFDEVADLGAGVQQPVVVHSGRFSWIDPAVLVDVTAGGAASAGVITLGNANKIENWRAGSPSWKRDGTTIGFAVGEIGMYTIAANPGNGDWGTRINVGDGVFASAVAYSPIDDDLLFYDGSNIYRATPGQPQNPAPLVAVDYVFGGMDWLPDGSGFVYGMFSTFLGFGNLYLYRFGDAAPTQLTTYDDAYGYHPSVAPDGQHLVYAYLATGEETPQLMIRTLDGAQTWALGVAGQQPDWGTGAQTPQPTPTPGGTPVPTPPPGEDLQQVFLPAVTR